MHYIEHKKVAIKQSIFITGLKQMQVIYSKPYTLETLLKSYHAYLLQHSTLKPWSHGLASRSKLKTWVSLRLRLARPCMHLR